MSVSYTHLIIQRAYEKTGQRVVILVDEYDKPMLQSIGNEELQKQFRDTLKPFYGALKTMDGCIKFALLTDVYKRQGLGCVQKLLLGKE